MFVQKNCCCTSFYSNLLQIWKNQALEGLKWLFQFNSIDVMWKLNACRTVSLFENVQPLISHQSSLITYFIGLSVWKLAWYEKEVCQSYDHNTFLDGDFKSLWTPTQIATVWMWSPTQIHQLFLEDKLVLDIIAYCN